MQSKIEQPVTLSLVALTAIATVLAFVEIAAIGAELGRAEDWFGVGRQVIFAIVVALLTYGFFVYFLTRLGYLQRRASHVPADRGELEGIFAGEAQRLVVLVPSYKEELAIVRRTLLSAALQEYPHRRVVLLIDDPCQPSNAADAAALEGMRRLPRNLQQLFAAPASRFAIAESDFARRHAAGSYDPRAEAMCLARCYDDAAEWFAGEIRAYPIGDHGDQLFVNGVLTRWRDLHRDRAAHLARLAEGDGIERQAARREYRRLTALFRVEFASFERKRYENLSHEVNKAMNLNSYLALMGKSFREMPHFGGGGVVLREVKPGRGTIDVHDAELILTLDADSVLLPDYALRLAHLMGLPGNERVAVVQTPYSAFPGAPGVVERIAGATTDIQYLIHQGFTRFNATFWVGANALLRKAALEDICTEHDERGHRVRKFIQDRTVIEDTESSIDLADRDWTLVNYPERLAYSATPSDFGSLLIQRRRWANGGLIILPKALRYLFRGPQAWRKAGEGFCRIHYLTSVAFANAALLVILFGPFDRNADIAWLLVSSLPYMYVYARDLVLCGYRWSDFLRVYALNLLLVPIHLGGALKSLHQAATGKKTPFARTPKVTGRTAAPGAYVLAEYGLLMAALLMLGTKIADRHWMSAAFALTYAAASGYAIFAFIGWRASVEDLRLWLRPPEMPKPDRRVGDDSAPGLPPKPQAHRPLLPLGDVRVPGRHGLHVVQTGGDRRRRVRDDELAVPVNGTGGARVPGKRNR